MLREKCDVGGEAGSIPIVALPPTLILPKRRKGVERMVMLGESLRITITSDGLEGMSLEVIVGDDFYKV